MTNSVQNDSVVILFRGGPPTSVASTRRGAAARLRVPARGPELSVSERHGLIGIHGYRLLAPQNSWERFWTIEFPNLDGAEAWMAAETEPRTDTTASTTIPSPAAANQKVYLGCPASPNLP